MLSTSLPGLVDQYLAFKSASGVSPATLRVYRQRVGSFVSWLGERPLSRAAVRDYVLYLRGEGLEPVSIAGYVRDVATFCGWLVEEGEVDRNPASKVVPRVPRRRPASYSVEQLRALLAVCDVRDRAIVLVLLDTGLRSGELVQLRRNRIEWETGHCTVVGKGNKERACWLSPVTLEAVRAYLVRREDGSVALWLGRNGPLTPNGVHQMLARRAAQAGIRSDVRRLAHAFRATFAKHYIQRGGDLVSLADLLGHATLDMARHYSQLADDELARKKATVNPLAIVLEEV